MAAAPDQRFFMAVGRAVEVELATAKAVSAARPRGLPAVVIR